MFASLVLGFFGHAEGVTPMAPRDPLLKLTLQEREDLRQAACGVHPATSIEARHKYRETRWREEYARVECAPYRDGQGSVFVKIAKCQHNMAANRWECAKSEATAETHVAGHSVSIRYENVTLPLALEIVSFLLSMPDVGGIEPSRFTLSEMSVKDSFGFLYITVHVDDLRITFHLDRVQSEDHPRFRIKRVVRGRSDVIYVDPDDPSGLDSIAPKYK